LHRLDKTHKKGQGHPPLVDRSGRREVGLAAVVVTLAVVTPAAAAEVIPTAAMTGERRW
jgi:hypothetical protein